MVIDLTDKFKTKYEQELIRLENYEESGDQSHHESTFFLSYTAEDHKKVQKEGHSIPIEYQLSLKYAQDVQYSLIKISSILDEKKENYFSNAAYSLNSFTNLQRNEFDEETKTALMSVSKQINELQTNCERQLAILQEKQLKSGKGTINQTYYGHLKEVILCLHQNFRRIQEEFSEFLKFNQIKKRKILSTLTIEQPTQNKSLNLQRYNQAHSSFEKRDLESVNSRKNSDTSSNQEATELRDEVTQFYMEKMDDQSKTIQTKKTIQSIHEMLSEMSKKVLDQEILTSSFEDITAVGLNYLEDANKNLVEANKLSKQSGKYWVYFFLSLSLAVLILDFLKS